ncbi:hypothetical protein [Sinorhizobium medicae]
MVGWPKILGDVLVLAAITWVVVEIREYGARSIKDAIERQNNDADSQSDADRSDYDRCLDGAACGTSAPANVAGLRRVVGTDLIGARGATPADQRKIDRTVVGICAAAV